jgi:hypothetical protein
MARLNTLLLLIIIGILSVAFSRQNNGRYVETKTYAGNNFWLLDTKTGRYCSAVDWPEQPPDKNPPPCTRAWR